MGEQQTPQNTHGETTWQEAIVPLALSIDIGSSSVRALTFDARGFQIRGSEHQIPYRLHTTTDGGWFGDADTLFELVCDCIDGALGRAGDHTVGIGAVATSTYWHSLMGVSADLHPTSPVLMWGDTRSGNDVNTLHTLLEGASTHQETGCRFHSSYWPAKLLWLERTQPDVVATTTTWCSFADFVDMRLHGSRQTSISLASGTGLMRIDDSTWHTPLLDALDLGPERLPELVDRDAPLPPLLRDWFSRWPQLRDVPWFPAIGDGAAANVGTGAVGPDRIAITIGTSGAMRVITDDAETARIGLSDRIWSYRLDRDHRVTGGALSNGGNVTGWLARKLAGGDFEVVTAEAEQVGADRHGLTILPLLAGERSPGWNDDATGVFAGVTLATRRSHIYRATLEATAYRFAAIYEALQPFVASEHHIFVNGGAALQSPLWLAIIADTLGQPVSALDADAEASARGAAIAALQVIGALPSIRPDSPSVRRRFEPDPANNRAYQEGIRRQARLEAAMLTFWEGS